MHRRPFILPRQPEITWRERLIVAVSGALFGAVVAGVGWILTFELLYLVPACALVALFSTRYDVPSSWWTRRK